MVNETKLSKLDEGVMGGYNWKNRHFGLIKGGDFFELDSWPSPKNNPEILLPNPKDLLILYEIKDKESIKISVNSII